MAGNMTLTGMVTAKDLTVTNAPLFKAGVGVMNGAWLEERLAVNWYRWTQVVSMSVNAPNQFVTGTNYYGDFAIPAKPAGATITSVHPNLMFTSDTGRLVIGSAPMSTLAVWKWRVVSIGYEMSGSATANVEFIAYGTKP